MHTPEGTATILVRRTTAAVEATAWGEGAGWSLDGLPALIGADDNWELETDHPLVRDLVRRNRGKRFGSTRLVTEALMRAVVEQRVTSREAHRSWAALRRAISEPGPGPHGLLPPDPERIARMPYYEFHRFGIEKNRADTLRRVAKDRERIDALRDRTSDEARSCLERLPGVGEWSSAQTVIASHGDPDAVPVGDFHHKHQVAYHLTGRPRGTDEEMMELLEPFRPHRGRILRLLWTLDRYPAFAPGRPTTPIAGL